MKQLLPGVTAEETRDSAKVFIVFYPRLGMFCFIFFLAMYVFFMNAFTQPGSFNEHHYLETLTGYGLFLLLFSPMLYLAFVMWKGKTILELTKDRLKMRYNMPVWFSKKRKLPEAPVYFNVREAKYTDKGVTKTQYLIYWKENGELRDFTHFYYFDQAHAIAAYLNEQSKRLSAGQQSSGAGRKSDG